MFSRVFTERGKKQSFKLLLNCPAYILYSELIHTVCFIANGKRNCIPILGIISSVAPLKKQM